MIIRNRIKHWVAKHTDKGLAYVVSRSQNTVLDHLRNLANESSAQLIQQRLLGPETLVFSSKQKLRSHFFSPYALKELPALILDFGVKHGDSTIMLADALGAFEGRKVVGFDAFLGLRNEWSNPDRSPGYGSLGGKIPYHLTQHDKVQLEVGWVEDTLPLFLADQTEKIGLAHLDMDVYPPTKFVLESLAPFLEAGSRLAFDDFLGFVGWENHSYRAFSETFQLSSFRCLAVSPACVVFEFVG